MSQHSGNNSAIGLIQEPDFWETVQWMCCNKRVRRSLVGCQAVRKGARGDVQAASEHPNKRQAPLTHNSHCLVQPQLVTVQEFRAQSRKSLETGQGIGSKAAGAASQHKQAVPPVQQLANRSPALSGSGALAGGMSSPQVAQAAGADGKPVTPVAATGGAAILARLRAQRAGAPDQGAAAAQGAGAAGATKPPMSGSVPDSSADKDQPARMTTGEIKEAAGTGGGEGSRAVTPLPATGGAAIMANLRAGNSAATTTAAAQADSGPAAATGGAAILARLK